MNATTRNPKANPALKDLTTLELANELLRRLSFGGALHGSPEMDQAARLLARLEYRADYLEQKAKGKRPIGFAPCTPPSK